MGDVGGVGFVTMTIREWRTGDRVRHLGRPEWGLGQVTSAASDTQDGRLCQRLTIRFERAGPKTISTAFADIRPADELPVMAEAPQREDDPLSVPEGVPAEELLVRVPENATDPFLAAKSRLANTLALYRFSEGGASLLDWAAMQTGMKDPLARFNRHELESFFQRFQANLDAHLKRLVKDLRRQEPGVLAQAGAAATGGAAHALRRADSNR